MRIYPFRGIHYGGHEDGGDLAAPPYDQIDDRLREELHGRVHQFAHLSRPVAANGGDRYHHAADLHHRWLDDGVLERDDNAALYVNEIVLPSGGRRLGLTALLGLEPPDSRLIQPHEETLAKAITDRLELLRAMRVDLEPILVLADDEGRLDRMLEEDCSGPALVEHRDTYGNLHRLVPLHGADRIARYRQSLATVRGLIADGHHRYKVAGLYAEEVAAEPDTPAASKLSVVTSLASPALRIDPIHRALREAPDLDGVASLVAERHPAAEATGPGLATAVARSSQPAIGVWRRGRTPEVWRLAPDRLGDSIPPARRRLPVALLHAAILPRLGLADSATTDGTLAYRSDPAALAEVLATGELELAFFLPPMDPAAFAAAVAEGGLLPPKSTRFLPKLVSGLVWAEH